MSRNVFHKLIPRRFTVRHAILSLLFRRLLAHGNSSCWVEVYYLTYGAVRVQNELFDLQFWY